MTKLNSAATLEDFGRVRLSRHFFMREFLYSDIANFHGLSNIPDDPDLAITVGRQLCEQLLEPLNATFGRIAIRSAFRSSELNGFGNEQQKSGRKGYNCASNAANHAGHIWDRRDKEGRAGATACVVIPWFADRYAEGADWRSLAWWIHDHLPYSSLCFFPKLCAFNLTWREQPERVIRSYIKPTGILTRPGIANHEDDHTSRYEGFPQLVRP